MKQKISEKIRACAVEINALLDERLATFQRFGNHNCLLRHVECPEGRIAIQPIYGTQFFGFASFIEIVQKYGLCFYIDVMPNFVDQFAPVLYIYSDECLLDD